MCVCSAVRWFSSCMHDCVTRCSPVQLTRLERKGKLKVWCMTYGGLHCGTVLSDLQQNVWHCEDNCGPCPTIGHAFLGAALILKIYLDLLTVGDLKPKLPSTFSITGKMGNVYSKLLQIAAVLTIDLTFTTILKLVDIEKANCNTMVDANTVKGV